jgi:MoaA/NifB/PqqE/SkfB family radical SAM enzyme
MRAKYNLKKSPPTGRGVKYYANCKLKKRPLLVNLEITKRCNARCDFCACWQIGSPNELSDYAPVIKKLRPVVCSVSGGEPLVRKNWYEILKNLRPYCHYMVLITNGALLTEEVAAKLSDAGVNQLAVSLDYLSERHDEVRKIPGLYKKVSEIIPKLTAKGYKIVLNTVIMESNIDHILPLTHKASSWGAGISFSSFCSLKRGDDELMIRDKRLEKLENLVVELKNLKRTLGHIRNSNYYLDGVPRYFRKGGMGKCKAGKNWVQVTPDGFIQPCTEMPRMCYFEEYEQKKVPKISCTECWYACRGEAEAPHLAPDRLIELIRA